MKFVHEQSILFIRVRHVQWRACCQNRIAGDHESATKPPHRMHSTIDRVRVSMSVEKDGIRVNKNDGRAKQDESY